MSKIVEIIKNYNVQLALKNIFSKIDEIIRYINSNPSGSGTVTSVTASSPLISSGGENPNISISYTPENLANKGVANGYAPLSSDAKVDAAYLPAYVDEVLEYANLAAFPVTGASDKIYIALDTNKVYRWSGSTYIEVAANSGVWGAITGTITNQTDLINLFNLKYIVRSLQMNSFNPADATTYYLGNYSNNPATNIQQRLHKYNNNYTVKIINLFVLQSINASNENVSFALINVTTNTVLSIGTFTSDYGTGISKVFTFNVNISVNNTDNYTYRIITPTWVTNPTNWTLSIEEYLI